MSVIDVQNAKQIRDPMTVLVKMEVPEDVSVSYSDFVDVKIKDEELAERSWPMRALADLQGDGFALDGSHAPYDPTVTASATNGKLGVRGDIGADLQFKVTGDSTINGLSIAATGADSVIYNGQTAYFSDGQVIIPVGASSIVLEFPANEPDERVEVSLTMPGTSLQVTNDSIISCIVSLRSDLTIDNPTLPESEINIEVYNDVDISEVVASIPDDSPLTYSAGYTGDMSPERKFYISGQVTWADNVLTIHGVDAVHFLDKEISPYDILTRYMNNAASIGKLTGIIKGLIQRQGVSMDQLSLYYRTSGGVGPGNPSEEVYIPRGNLRELLAFCNNVFKIDNVPEAAFYYSYPPSVDRSYWFSYVDAGIPYLTDIKQKAKWIIDEDDCGEIKKSITPVLGTIKFRHTNARLLYRPCGSVTWQKDGPAYPSFDGDVYGGYRITAEGHITYKNYIYYKPRILPVSTNGSSLANPANVQVKSKVLKDDGTTRDATYGSRPLIDENTLQNLDNAESSGGGVIYTQVIPKNAYRGVDYDWVFPTLKDAWNALVAAGEIDASDETADLQINADAIDLIEAEELYSTGVGNGETLEIEGKIYGRIDFGGPGYAITGTAYPDMAIQSLLDRSNITGSFIWKGDPRMQPRDVVEFHRLDGTVEEITLENITLHHEGGGTYAEITYRKGVC